MRVWWIAFMLGVVALQRQAALPGAVEWTCGAFVLAALAGAGVWRAHRQAHTRAMTTLHLQAHVGRVADNVTRALSDQQIDAREAEQIIATGRKGQRLFQRLIHSARNLAVRRHR